MMSVDVSCRDHLDAEVLGEVAQERLSPRVSALERSLELDEETLAAESSRELGGRVRVEESQAATHAPREADEPFRALGDRLQRDRRLERFPVLLSHSPRPRVRRCE